MKPAEPFTSEPETLMTETPSLVSTKEGSWNGSSELPPPRRRMAVFSESSPWACSASICSNADATTIRLSSVPYQRDVAVLLSFMAGEYTGKVTSGKHCLGAVRKAAPILHPHCFDLVVAPAGEIVVDGVLH